MLLQVKFAQSGEDILFSVVCKDYFNNSRTCLLSVNEANQKIQVSVYCMDACSVDVIQFSLFCFTLNYSYKACGL